MYEITPYVLIYAVTVVLSAIVGFIVFKRHNLAGGKSLTLMMIAIMEWTITGAFELSAVSLESKIFWSKAAFFGITTAPVLFLLFVLEYNHVKYWLKRRNVILLFIIPLITLLLALTNEMHGLIWSGFSPGLPGSNIYIYEHGVFWWITLTGYSYLCVVIGTFLLLRSAMIFPKAYYRQMIALVSASLIAWGGSITYVFGFSPVPGLDTTPICLTVTGLILAVAILRLNLLDIVPVARDMLIETMSDCVLVLESYNRLVDINPSAQKLLGITLKDAVGKNLAGILQGNEELSAMICDENISRSEFLFDPIRPLWYEMTKSVLIEKKGKAYIKLIVLRDITERRVTENALRDSEEKFRKYFEMPLVGIAVISPEAKLLKVNQKLCDTFGYTAAELQLKAWKELIPSEDLTEEIIRFNDLLNGRVEGQDLEKRFVRKDGEYINAFVNSRFVKSSDGSPEYIIMVIQDITYYRKAEEDRLELERRLLQAQKLESLWLLAGGVAHDFNNYLTAIMGNLDLALMKSTAAFKGKSNLEEAITASQKAAETTHKMLIYTGSGPTVLKKADINRIIEENARLFSTSITRNALLNLNLADDIPLIEADAGQIEQVFINLLTNACEAIGENHGVITVSTGIIECDAYYLSRCRLENKPKPGSFVFFEITDTGAGMDEETKERLFDPFFTTKFTGRGLGMSAVMGIVRGHKGAVFVESELGEGTSVRILLPLNIKEQLKLFHAGDTEEYGQVTGGSKKSRGTFLVVDDEVIVGRMSSKILKHLGFRVFSAEDGPEAIEIFKEKADEITCVILDISLPGMDSLTVLSELREIKSDVKVILSTSMDEHEASERFSSKGFNGFIHKPYLIKNISKVIEKVI
jgi:PAS domain S-box-containing protein